jgi:predicted nuclease of predicted toxin-antitoxin system
MLDADIAKALRDEGHDVLRFSEIGMARADDAEILDKAIRHDRIIVTLDEHFGDWVVLPLSEHPGVIRVKANPATTSRILDVLIPFLRTHHDRRFKNQLVIVKEDAVRWIDTSSAD